MNGREAPAAFWIEVEKRAAKMTADDAEERGGSEGIDPKTGGTGEANQPQPPTPADTEALQAEARRNEMEGPKRSEMSARDRRAADKKQLEANKAKRLAEKNKPKPRDYDQKPVELRGVIENQLGKAKTLGEVGSILEEHDVDPHSIAPGLFVKITGGTFSSREYVDWLRKQRRRQRGRK